MKSFEFGILFAVSFAVTGIVTSQNDGSSTSVWKNIGETVWYCTKSTLISAVSTLKNDTTLADKVNCWYQNKYEGCLRANLTKEAKTLSQFHKDLLGLCSNKTVSTTTLQCIAGYVPQLELFGCSPVTNEILLFNTSIKTQDKELQGAYCRFSELTEGCVDRVTRYCGLGGPILVNEISSIRKINTKCESYINKTKDELPPIPKIEFPTFPTQIQNKTNEAGKPVDSCNLCLPNVYLLFTACVFLLLNANK